MTTTVNKTMINQTENTVYTKVMDLWYQKWTIHTNQTGKFLVTSRHGNRYSMVMMSIDDNVIFVKPIKNCNNTEFQQAYRHLLR